MLHKGQDTKGQVWIARGPLSVADAGARTAGPRAASLLRTGLCTAEFCVQVSFTLFYPEIISNLQKVHKN